MRLIDANEFIEYVKFDRENMFPIGDTRKYDYAIGSIRDIPTVDAIPIDWIVKWSAEHMEYGTLTIENLINDWRNYVRNN